MASFSDDFNRSDGALGANYTRGRGPTDGVAIVSNAAQVGNTDLDAMYIRSAETFDADQELQVTIASGVGNQPGHVGYVEIGCRMSGSDATLAGYTVYTANADDSAISRLNAGSASPLKSITLSVTAADTLKIRTTGQNPVVISVYKNGVLVDSYSDSSGSRVLSGKPGVGGYSNSALYLPTLDDATGTDVTSGSSATVTPAQAAISIAGKTPATTAFQFVRIRELLVNASGQPVGNATDIGLRVWYSGICAGSPDVSLNSMTTDAGGTTSWSIPTGPLSYQQPIFYVAQNSVSYSHYACGRLIPNYE